VQARTLTLAGNRATQPRPLPRWVPGAVPRHRGDRPPGRVSPV